MVEVNKYLDLGYTPNEIKSGKAFNESYTEAHNVAERAHLSLFQDVSKQLYGKSLPLSVVYLTQPFIEEHISAFDQALDRLEKHYTDQDFSEVKSHQIIDSINMFSKFGAKYHTPQKLYHFCDASLKSLKRLRRRKSLKK